MLLRLRHCTRHHRPLAPCSFSSLAPSTLCGLAAIHSRFMSLSPSQAEPSASALPPPAQLIAGKTRLGWVGTGVMGAAMCAHCMRALSLPTTVYNRTRSKTDGLREMGATVVDSPEEVAANCDILVTMLGFPADVRSVYLGNGAERTGVLSRLAAGAVAVDMTTSEPSLAVEIAQAARGRGVHAIDAPVSGGDVGAREARLSIMVGGERGALDAVTPLLQAMGKSLTHCGAAGCGQHTKMVNQVLIASSMGLLYAQAAGLDLTTTISAVAAGAAGSWSISNLGPRIVKRDFAPGFYVEHFIKDLGIVLAESRRMQLSMPGLALAYSLYMALLAQGGGRQGTQALYTALETLNARGAGGGGGGGGAGGGQQQRPQ